MFRVGYIVFRRPDGTFLMFRNSKHITYKGNAMNIHDNLHIYNYEINNQSIT